MFGAVYLPFGSRSKPRCVGTLLDYQLANAQQQAALNAYGGTMCQAAQLQVQQDDLSYRCWQEQFAAYDAMKNARPPVHVPQGWADWFAIGDQLH